MPKKESTLTNAILVTVYVAGGLLEMLVKNSSPYRWRAWALYGKGYESYYNCLYHLRRRGLVEVESKNGKKFIKLTQKGQLEALLAKAKMPQRRKWDGKWRIIIFDIPEKAKIQRNQFRRLLKTNNFMKLQGSVYISPLALNKEAIGYLKQTKLIDFIRIIKVEEIDDDSDLKKKFKLF
jgi:CRISPR-associated endonuclease Cas2